MIVAFAMTVALAGGDAFREGVEAYRAGRYADALAALARAEQEAGDRAAPELLYDKALAALGAGDPHEAQASAERAAARGGPDLARAADFVRGNAAFLLCESAEKDAEKPDALPDAYDAAIASAETARDAWIAAASREVDDPAARRNVERAVRKIEDLKRKKKEREEKQKPESQPSSRPSSQPSPPESRPQSQPSSESQPSPKDPQQPQEQQQDQPPQPKDSESQEPPPNELSPEEVQRLLDKLDEKDQERREKMRARVRIPMRAKKDW
ncbi:MAG TPA: hypothetical protein VKE69_08320 [Planctomycetota bacterium]|nr:hypothetical protein [Planctomycetota bacterium]